MKKSLYILLTVTLVFTGIIVGVFIGRNTSGTIITLDPFSGNKPLSPLPTQNTSELGKVNINVASADQLMLLPGIGRAKAAAIIDFREEYGKFTRIEDLLYIDGFSRTTIESLRPYITLGG